MGVTDDNKMKNFQTLHSAACVSFSKNANLRRGRLTRVVGKRVGTYLQYK